MVGLIYVVEVLSDIIQVVYFKKTGGKRFFRMAPLHHHLEMGGWSENKLFCVFSGLTLLLCVLASGGHVPVSHVICGCAAQAERRGGAPWPKPKRDLTVEEQLARGPWTCPS